MRLGICFLLCALPAMVVIDKSQASVPGRHQAHGTVNIFLANQNGLAVVTDSMLTYADGTHPPEPVQKLFQLDDRTICTVAGEYISDAPQRSTLDLSVARTIRSFEIELRKHPIGSLVEKLRALSFALQAQFRLNTLANIIGANDPKLLPLQLTVAGYDFDGQLKIGKLEVHSVGSGYDTNFGVDPPNPIPTVASHVPACENAGTPAPSGDIRVVERSFVCRVAGVVSYADSILDHPSRYRGSNPAIKQFALFSEADQLTTLTTAQLLSVAIGLEQETEQGTIRAHFHEVGRDRQFAVLSGGKITKFQTVPENPGDQPSILSGRVVITSGGIMSRFPGNGIFPPFTRRDVFIFVDVRMSEFRAVLDGVYYGRDTFQNMQLVWNGDGPIFFGSDNIVDDCELILGPKVNRWSPDVSGFISKYRWKRVTRERYRSVSGPLSHRDLTDVFP
jgi:hypothetical protein